MRRSTFALIGLACTVIPAIALAFSNPSPGIIRTCVVPGLSCLSGGDLAVYISSTVLYAAGIAFEGVLLAALILYGIRRLAMPENESAFAETQQSLVYAFIGVVIMLGADLIASSFLTGGVVNPAGVNSVLVTVTIFLKALVGVFLLANITIQGFRKIVEQEEGEVSKGRKRFLHGCIGAAIVLLASPIVTTVVGSNSSVALTELRGIANFIITLFGILAVVAIIVSGIWLVVSIDDSMKERAKKLLIASLVALIVVISAAALVNFFILF